MAYVSNLPPGCTQRMIDDLVANAEWGCAECGANIWHEDDLYRCADCGEELCKQCSSHRDHAEPLCAACYQDRVANADIWPCEQCGREIGANLYLCAGCQAELCADCATMPADSFDYLCRNCLRARPAQQEAA